MFAAAVVVVSWTFWTFAGRSGTGPVARFEFPKTWLWMRLEWIIERRSQLFGPWTLIWALRRRWLWRLFDCNGFPVDSLGFFTNLLLDLDRNRDVDLRGVVHAYLVLLFQSAPETAHSLVVTGDRWLLPCCWTNDWDGNDGHGRKRRWCSCHVIGIVVHNSCRHGMTRRFWLSTSIGLWKIILII